MSCRTVYLIDDDPSSRRGLARQISNLGPEVWPFTGASHFLQTLEALDPSCSVLGGDMTKRESFAVLEELARRQIDWPVIVVASRGDLRSAVRAMQLGARDYLQQPVPEDELIAALGAAGMAVEQIARASAARRQAQERLAMLTPRELDVARALLQGMSNKMAAHHLGLSVRTVEMHRASMMRKLGARTIAEGAALMTQAGQLPLRKTGSK